MPKHKIKVIFCGTPQFAVPCLQALAADANFNIQSVITREDKKVGRKQIITAPPVKEMALNLGLPVLQPHSLKGNSEFISMLKGLSPDFIIVTAYGQILPAEMLNIPKYGCINLHGSLLPKYRGASPVEEALLNGDTSTGITFIKMNSRLDGGDILLIQRVKIDQEDNSLTLRAKLSLLGATLIPFLLKDIVEGQFTPIPQNDSNATYCRKISKEDGLIDLEKMSAREIINRIRAYTPWPSCFLVINGKKLKIIEALCDDSHEKSDPSQAGKAILTGKDEVAFQTASGLLIPKTVQLEGKNSMLIQDFLRGNSSFFK
jgi:methionyl-tRNA formyltransferase